MRGPTGNRQHKPHLAGATTTGSARTKDPNGVRTGQPHPADSTPDDKLAQLTDASSKIEIQGGRYPDALEAQTNL